MRRDLRPVRDPAPRRTLAAMRREFERWRSDPARPRRIPEALWRAAAEIARAHGVSKTARTLGLDYYALEQRLRASPGREPSRAFVELPWPVIASAPDYRLELEDGRGARLRVEVRGVVRADVAALARVLWSAAR
jgi:hypothetical protein